jgi:PAS domain S-box-containing protein
MSGQDVDPSARDEIARLRSQVEDLRSALAAIQDGGADAIMVGAPGQARLYTLTGADRPHRVLVEQMGEGAATLSEGGVILYVNASLAAMLQRTAQELVGTAAAALVDPGDRPLLATLLAAAPGHTNRGELTFIRADGTTVHCIGSATGLDNDGVLVRGLIVVDISERHRAEIQLAEINAQIAARSADLERANIDLARSNEELSQFASVASHDLAQPLYTIAGFADLLAKQYHDEFDADARQFLDAITSTAERMQHLIRDLLAYSRVDSNVEPLERVDTADLLTTVLADLGARIDALGATVEVDALPSLTGDPIQLGQVFANLIGNALTYVAPGVTPHVHVFAQPGDEQWRFTVADNGIGIDAAQRAHVFDMFKRLHSSDTYPGTGIGLATVRKVVERHGGRIWVEDNPSGGTAMCFTIPETSERVAEPPSQADDR